MSARYALTYRVDEALMRRAMLGWAKPARGKGWKEFFFGVTLAGIGGGLLGFFGAVDWITLPVLLAALGGFYVGLLLWFLLHRRSVRQLARHASDWRDRAGDNHAVIDATGVEVSNAVAESRAGWAAYDQVFAVKGATVLRSGALVYPIPDAALPKGVTADTFRADLSRWVEQAQ